MVQATTHDLLRRELTSSLKINARIRRLLNKRLDYISKQLKTPTLNVDKMPKLVEELIDMLEASATTTDRTSKLLLGPKATPPPDAAATGEQVLEELIRGRPTGQKGKVA
jgi:hypothetical protein